MGRPLGSPNKSIRELKAERARIDEKIRYKEKIEKLKKQVDKKK